MATLRAGDLTPQSLGKPRALRRAVTHPFPRSPGAGARDHGGRWVGGNGGPLTLHHGRSLASGRVQRGPPWLPGDPSGGSAAAPSATGGRHALKRARARLPHDAWPLPRFFRTKFRKSAGGVGFRTFPPTPSGGPWFGGRPGGPLGPRRRPGPPRPGRRRRGTGGRGGGVHPMGLRLGLGGVMGLAGGPGPSSHPGGSLRGAWRVGSWFCPPASPSRAPKA